MTRLVAESNAKVVLSFSPALLTAIGEAVRGNADHAAVLSATPVGELTAEDKAYIDQVFFVASPDQIERFPRYRELADKRAARRTLTTTEYRDLQALFNLAWTSPLLLQEEPLLSLAAKGSNFAEADIQVILDTHAASLTEFLESLVDLEEAGKIDLASTPLYNPTLPFLVRNRMDVDAVDQIARGAAAAESVLGVEIAGFAPHLGLIDQANAGSISETGYQWAIVSGSDGATPTRLTTESGSLLALPATSAFNDKVAQTYFLMDPNAAALDVVRTLAADVGGVAGGVVTLSADGTEPWGRYSDSGVAFLRSLLRQLGGATEFSTVLPTELEAALTFDPGPFPELPNSYLNESDELAAWAYLGETRRQLLRAREVGILDPETLDSVYELVMQTQDADWYWWFGEERSSEDDGYYDALFRSKLATAWELLGESPPAWALVALHEPTALAATRTNQPIAATIAVNNSITDTEWARAGYYEDRTAALVRRLYYTFDTTQLYIRIDFTTEVLGDSAPGFDLYFGGPSAVGSGLSPAGRALDFDANRVLRWRGTNPVRVSRVEQYPGSTPSDTAIVAGFDGNSVEFAVDLASVSADLLPGGTIDFRIVETTSGPETGAFPVTGHGQFEVPNLEVGTELARIVDQTRDDHGPGEYSYVVDSEVADGTYDLAGLVVRQLGGATEADPDASSQIQFEITFREPLTNPWTAPAGFSHQTIDLYLDAYPGTDTGARRLLPGRVAALEGAAGWDYAFTVDGWDAKHFTADTAGNVTELTTPIDYAVLSDRRTVLVTVDRAALPPGNEAIWEYGVAALANQAIPSLGVHELRQLATVPGRFRLGGGTGAANDPLLIDVLHPEPGVQEATLTPPEQVLTGDPDTVRIDRLGRLPLVGG